MNEERFHSGLNIAGHSLKVVNEELQAIPTRTSPPEVNDRLLHIRENVENCVQIIEALQRYLATSHSKPPPDRYLPHTMSNSGLNAKKRSG
ncbi:hypothetical protein EWH21_07200 [Pseudomonas sp. REST10]|uniref:hypothetical protein n=1 Tax=Pseudomonas sp. REST10 TaxID=2512235 RepID=UPI00240DCECA|nr:hypothetical protein [Pseudomonas sp. REST10]WFC61517.1 hypothetical protein EWH21_07200 [Pseudomonas sp. REST10]